MHFDLQSEDHVCSVRGERAAKGGPGIVDEDHSQRVKILPEFNGLAAEVLFGFFSHVFPQGFSFLNHKVVNFHEFPAH